VGIVPQCRKGVTNYQLYFAFKAIARYKSSVFTLFKMLSVITKQNYKR
jgi:hypothetical protein